MMGTGTSPSATPLNLKRSRRPTLGLVLPRLRSTSHEERLPFVPPLPQDSPAGRHVGDRDEWSGQCSRVAGPRGTVRAERQSGPDCRSALSVPRGPATRLHWPLHSSRSPTWRPAGESCGSGGTNGRRSSWLVLLSRGSTSPSVGRLDLFKFNGVADGEVPVPIILYARCARIQWPRDRQVVWVTDNQSRPIAGSGGKRHLEATIGEKIHAGWLQGYVLFVQRLDRNTLVIRHRTMHLPDGIGRVPGLVHHKQ